MLGKSNKQAEKQVEQPNQPPEARMANAEMIEGFRDGFHADDPEPGANRSDGYVHGFKNGRDDLNRSPRALAVKLRDNADAILARENG